MNLHIILVFFTVLVIGIGTSNYVFGQTDPLTEIYFLEDGIIHTDEHQFHISNDINIREFFNGNIIRISGQTIEGFPYITYTKTINDEINTFGKIFINGEFVKLSFVETAIENIDIKEKNDDIAIVVKYTSHVHAKNYAILSMKIFEQNENKLNLFNKKDGFISNVKIDVLVLDDNQEKFFSVNGTSNQSGFFETQFLIPDNYKRSELSIIINAENENSKSSKILQLFTLGNEPSSGKGCPSGTSLVNGVCVIDP
jgi:hypothetical protein